MNTIRKSPLVNSDFSFLMALAGFLGMACFINIKDNENKPGQGSVQNSMLPLFFLINYFKKLRFGVIILMFIILTIEENEE
jgi:hypothetical protein